MGITRKRYWLAGLGLFETLCFHEQGGYTVNLDVLPDDWVRFGSTGRSVFIRSYKD